MEDVECMMEDVRCILEDVQCHRQLGVWTAQAVGVGGDGHGGLSVLGTLSSSTSTLGMEVGAT